MMSFNTILVVSREVVSRVVGNGGIRCLVGRAVTLSS